MTAMVYHTGRFTTEFLRFRLIFAVFHRTEGENLSDFGLPYTSRDQDLVDVIFQDF